MEKNVTYKALLYILIGSVSGILAFTVNTSSKFDQIQKNKEAIDANKLQFEEDLKAVYDRFEKNEETIKANQIEIIKGISNLKVLVAKNNNK